METGKTYLQDLGVAGDIGECVLRAALPANTDGLYGDESGESAVAWTTSYGEGRITYFPVDYSRLQDGVKCVAMSPTSLHLAIFFPGI